jgi:hypothetical protein
VAARSQRPHPGTTLPCPGPARDPLRIAAWFVQRWQMGVTFREARDRLEAETQRQWSDLAIARMTPCLLGPFFLEEQSFRAIKMLPHSL